MIFASKGKTSRWGQCDHEVRVRVPTFMYDTLVRSSRGADKCDTLRDWIGEIVSGRLELVTGRAVAPPAGDTVNLCASVPSQMRDHIAALATLEGVSVEQYVEDVLSKHLYGLHATRLPHGRVSDKREVVES